MKKYAMLIGLMIVSTIIFAQKKVDPAKRAAHQADKMKTELSLTDDQYNSIKTINETYVGKHKSLRSDSTLTKDARRQQMKTLHQEKETAINKVLTEEQNTKRATLAKEHNGHRRRFAEDHAVRMQKDLSLSDEQTAKIKAIDSEFAGKFKNLRKDSTLAKEDSRKQFKALREEYHGKTKAVLTADQLKKWEAQKADRKKRKTRKG